MKLSSEVAALAAAFSQVQTRGARSTYHEILKQRRF